MKARLPQGYGKQSQQQLMQQVQQMQENMRKKQEELENTEYSVTSGGGMVELSMSGKHQVTKLTIHPDVVEKDDVEMLEDLIAAAVNEAVRVVDEASEREMGALTGGLSLPGMGL